MFHDPFSMVVAIVLIVTIGRVLRSRYKAQNGVGEARDETGNNQQRLINDPEGYRMRDEIRALKDRIQVLERIATDNNSASDINRQIEELRDR